MYEIFQIFVERSRSIKVKDMRLYLIYYGILCINVCGIESNKKGFVRNPKVFRNNAEERELVYLQILSSNGYYAPTELYYTDENSESDWPEGLGSLTKLGKSQLYELGKYLRKHYDNFITSAPYEIDVFSSAEGRSSQSAMSLAASLYAPTPEWEFLPGFAWQPVTISYLDKEDIFFSQRNFCLTQIFQQKEILETFMSKFILLTEQKFLKFWSNNSGSPIRNWFDVVPLQDTLEKEKRAGLKIPKWALKYWDDLKRLAHSAYLWSFTTEISLQLRVGALIDFMTVRMRAKILPDDPDPKIKTSIYMTHDWNIAAFLFSTYNFHGNKPPPCTTIAIELYNDTAMHPNIVSYSVRMLLFNSTSPEEDIREPFVLQIPNCDVFCPLQDFLEYFKDFIPEDYNQLCVRYIKDDENSEDVLKEYANWKEKADRKKSMLMDAAEYFSEDEPEYYEYYKG